MATIPKAILNYMMRHRPDTIADSAALHALDDLLPGIYDPAKQKTFAGHVPGVNDAEAFEVFSDVRGNPDALVDIFRAVPKGQRDFNTGDWVSVSKGYAHEHGKHALNGDYDIITTKARAGDISEPGDSIFEQGFWGNPVKGSQTWGLAPLGVGTAAMAAALLGDGSDAEAAPRRKALQQGLSLMGLLDEAPAPKAVLPVPENIPLPELQGSPKQVEWANKIREEKIEQMEKQMAYLDNIRKRIDSGVPPADAIIDEATERMKNGDYSSAPIKVTREFFEKNRDKLYPQYLEEVRQNPSASFFIDKMRDRGLENTFKYKWIYKPENMDKAGIKRTKPQEAESISVAPAGVGTAALAASLLAGADEAKAAAINAALADPASREKAAAAGLPYDPPVEEAAWSPADLLIAPVGAAGIPAKLLAMALDAPVTLGLDAGLSALGGLFGGGDRKKPGGW